MQNPQRSSLLRTLDWLLVPLLHAEYRRMMFRCCVLSARLEVLCTVSAVLSPFATPGMLQVMRRWSDQLARDVADFKRIVRVQPVPTVARVSKAVAVPFQNPWR
jgi:hypothetical protein